ncbi:MAG TPA: hypothetical protein VF735_08155 [Pyrinomonadaceae bacterium]|jgi:hypothetical protein
MKTVERSGAPKAWAIMLALALLTLTASLCLSDSMALAVQQNSNRSAPRSRRARRIPSNGNQSNNRRAEQEAQATNANAEPSSSNAQQQPASYRMENPRSDVRMDKVLLIGDKELTDDMIVQPGTEITYATAFVNQGTGISRSLSIIDPVQDMTDFKLGSVTSELGTTGLKITVSYSKDDGQTCNYTPVSGGGGAPAGFDRLVNAVCLNFSGDLSNTAPNNSGRFSYVGRRR